VRVPIEEGNLDLKNITSSKSGYSHVRCSDYWKLYSISY